MKDVYSPHGETQKQDSLEALRGAYEEQPMIPLAWILSLCHGKKTLTPAALGSYELKNDASPVCSCRWGQYDGTEGRREASAFGGAHNPGTALH